MQNYNFKPLVSIPKTLNSWGKILLFRCLEYLKIAVIIALNVVVQHKTVFIDKDWDRITIELFVVFQNLFQAFILPNAAGKLLLIISRLSDFKLATSSSFP